MNEDRVSPDVVAIEGLLTAFQDAVAQGDVRALEGCLGEDVSFVFTGGEGPVRNRRVVLETWTRHLAQWTDVRIERRDTSVRIHGDAAWASFLWDGEGSAQGDRYRVAGERWTLVMLWEDEGWRIVDGHSSLPFRDWRSLKVEESRT